MVELFRTKKPDLIILLNQVITENLTNNVQISQFKLTQTAKTNVHIRIVLVYS